MTRYCKNCRRYMLHDKVVYYGQNQVSLPERIFQSIFTFGMLEILSDKYWKCQKCNILTDMV